MGRLRRSQPEQVRQDQVRRIAKALTEEHEAGMVSAAADMPELDRRYRAAESTLAAVERNSIKAEIEAGYELFASGRRLK